MTTFLDWTARIVLLAVAAALGGALCYMVFKDPEALIVVVGFPLVLWSATRVGRRNLLSRREQTDCSTGGGMI